MHKEYLNMTITNIRCLFEESIAIKNQLLKSDQLDVLVNMADDSSEAIQQGNKIMLCGNGGSAADAQHLAAEMLVRLRPHNNREGVPAIALALDTSTITACGNDFGFDYLFERLVSTLGNKGDILIGITTSGNSKNVIRAMKVARANGIKVFGFLGAGGGKALELCDASFLVPSDNTGRIQESHITAGHALMECIEDKLLNDGYLHLSEG
jgi:D-sedoheptulose 7-phosphate isomerase